MTATPQLRTRRGTAMITLTPCPAGATPLRPDAGSYRHIPSAQPRPGWQDQGIPARMSMPVPPGRDSRATSSLRIDQQQLLAAGRQRRGTPRGSRALTCFWQAVLGLPWFRDRTAADALARDHGISRATAYRYLDEVVIFLAEQAPDLREALERPKDKGFSHLILDGKIIPCHRCKEPAFSVRGEVIDLWYSGKAHAHGGNVQAVLAPDGFLLWVSQVEPSSVARHHRRPRPCPARALPGRRGRPARPCRPRL
jgi:hypothetical protein